MDELKTILKNNPSLSLDEDTLAVANSGYGNVTKRISLRGGEFRKLIAGQEVSTDSPTIMQVIIVKMAHNASRSYYSHAYEEGKKVSPVCWSNDSTAPDPEVLAPQSKFCHACPNSVRGSGSGGTGSACRLSWRLAVVSADDPGGDVMQLVLPGNSCFGKEEEGKWPFKAYIQMLVKNNVSASKLVTKMQFDNNPTRNRVLFSPVAAVVEEHKEILKRQADSPAAQSAIKLSVYQPPEAVRETVKFEVFDDVKKGVTTRSERQEQEVLDIVNKWKKVEE
jgi:hypothetical protein